MCSVHLHIYVYIFYVYIYICAKYSHFLCNLVEKMWLFNREVRYKIHSGSGLAGSGSEMIYSGSDSGSGKKFRIRPDPTPDPDPQHWLIAWGCVKLLLTVMSDVKGDEWWGVLLPSPCLSREGGTQPAPPTPQVRYSYILPSPTMRSKVQEIQFVIYRTYWYAVISMFLVIEEGIFICWLISRVLFFITIPIFWCKYRTLFEG